MVGVGRTSPAEQTADRENKALAIKDTTQPIRLFGSSLTASNLLVTRV